MRRTLIPIGAAVLLLSACTTTNGGTPSPSSPTSDQPTTSGSATGLPGPGVPKVESPIDVTHFKSAPCDALTADQITGLLGPGVTPKTDLNAPAGPSCSIHPPEVTQAGVLVIFTDVDDRGLTSLYAAKDVKYPFFMPLSPVDGYPVVAYGLADDRASRGTCQIAVGTSDQQTVDIGVTQSEQNVGKTDPCEAARGVAASVLGNLREVK
ncbi:MAG TPA: DUF3558 domain-containing protein [Amycolatopsis sp.]|uniref:DUF3558 domain-containing protein n=1 Tax=Amycolatopsis nalaikhensis TaxID=715472 RepID=A0ABY8XTG4_9PSEU|nr:DUF3558 domain-containing protein [Amycolatopsis sp. 2-2]WIV58878.1 DUF3558 domain-containing protein [Amycolatopsis sp. 2-2]